MDSRIARGARGSLQGASLATVMMVVAMMMALAFTLVGIAFNHLNLSFKNSSGTRAKHLAEATLAKAIDAIVKDQEFGTTGTGEERTIRVTLDSLPDGSVGVLSFDPDVALSENVPHSTNNRGDAPIQGYGSSPVPAESFHLVARGTVKNSTSRVEAVITIPRFPFSVASEGAIRSDGGLVVAAVKPGVPYDLDYPLHEEDLEPGHLVSNSQIGDGAIVLNGENRIYGDVQSSSGVTLEADTAVLGEVRTNAQKESLPEIQAMTYDPELEPGMQTVNSGAGQLDLEGYNKSYSDLTVDNGIRLNGGVLYVDGDLTVSAGGVTGKGALIATGDITIYGGGEATSDNEAALIADGDITLRGTTTDKAQFAGLIYTNGQLQAENLRLAGVFVASGNDSEVDFKNTEVYQDLSKANIEIQTETTSTFELPTLNPPTPSLYGHSVPITYDPAALSSNLENYRNPNTGAGQPEYLFKIPFAGSSTGYITHTFDTSGVVGFVETPGPDGHVVDGAALGITIFGQTVTSEAEAESVTLSNIEALVIADGGSLDDTQRDTIRRNARGYYAALGAGFGISSASAEYTANGGNASGGGGGTTTDPFEWSLDFSEFYDRSDFMRVLYWADYKNG